MKLKKIQKTLRIKDKYDIIFLLLALAGLVASLAIVVNLPDPRPDYLRETLESKLNNTDLSHIDFEIYKNIRLGRTVFRSSEPIFFFGEYVEYWQFTFVPGMASAWRSYPEIRIVEPFIDILND